MKDKVNAIILKVSYPVMGDTSKIEILGKTMLDWVCLSLSDSPYKAISYDNGQDFLPLIKPHLTNSEYTVLLYSDTPLITRKTVLDAVYELENSNENALSMTRGYVFKTQFLLNAQVVSGFNHRFFDEEDFLTAFSFKQVAMIADVLRNRIISYHMSQGVQFNDPNSTFISCDTIIEKNVIIAEGNTVNGKSIIKEGVRLNKGNTITDSVLDENSNINNSVIESSYIGKNCSIGPFSHIKKNAKIGDNCRIGNFVEVKNSIIEGGTKAAHLSYIGDADIGKNCNIGCGTVFCNYDGVKKHRSKVGDNVFIGSNSNLIAPVTLNDNSVIAAGSTITQDVERDSLAIARSRQINKQNYTLKEKK